MRSNSFDKSLVKKLGDLVKIQRQSLGLTQKELGSYAGCGALFIHELEKGKETIRLNKLIDVLKVLGLQLTVEPGKTGLQVRGFHS